MSEELAELSVSFHYDSVLALVDIEGSRAHVRGLARAGILHDDEVAALLAALDVVDEEFRSGHFVASSSDEDIHTAVERRVTEIAGSLGAKLHTGRSRNDQVATDLRLWCKGAVASLLEDLLAFQEVLLDRANGASDAYLPGYTHLQRAQPVLLAHHLLAHFWAFSRDVDRFITTARRLDVSPLGAGALAGTSLPLDPTYVAAELGFATSFENSLDAVSDRDFVAEILFNASLSSIHCSRLGEELILWTTEEFGFAVLHDAYATGSSMLPQKKNPDIAELARGKSGRLLGNLAGFLATLKGLPLAYNRDLQEDKEPLFDAVSQLAKVLRALRGLMATIEWRVDRMKAAGDDPNAAAVDLAEFLVLRSMPFREAHALVGRLVAESLGTGASLSRLVESEPALGPEAARLLAPGMAVENRRSKGGAGPVPLARQMQAAVARLAEDRTRLVAIRHE